MTLLAAGGERFFTARVPVTSSMALEGELVGDFGLEVYVLIEGCRGVLYSLPIVTLSAGLQQECLSLSLSQHIHICII